VVVDAKLSSFAIQQLSEITEHVVSMTKTAFRGDDVDSAAKDLSAGIIQYFLLDEPIVPGLTGNYAGVFVNSTGTDVPEMKSSEEKGWRNGYLLALFFRAMLTDENKVGKAVASQSPLMLVETLMHVVNSCYTVKQDHAAVAAGKCKKK